MRKIKLLCIVLLLLVLPVAARQPLQSCEQLAETAALSSPVVMMNEAHDGDTRLVRSRVMGAQLLPIFHRHGFRLLSLEALSDEAAKTINATRQLPIEWTREKYGYVSQPDMRKLLQTALDLGWEVRGYDVDRPQYLEKAAWLMEGNLDTIMTVAYTQWREQAQAENLLRVWHEQGQSKMVVWAGNGHLCELPSYIAKGEFGPGSRERWLIRMGEAFKHLSEVDPFTIDQTSTAEWPRSGMQERGRSALEEYGEELSRLGGNGGYLMEADTVRGPKVDAVFLSLDNKME